MFGRRWSCLKWWRRRPLFSVSVAISFTLFFLALRILKNRSDLASYEENPLIDRGKDRLAVPWHTTSEFVLPDKNTALNNPKSDCDTENGANVFALFMVISDPRSSEARNIIRKGFKLFLKGYSYNDERNNTKTSYLSTPKRNSLLFFTGLPERHQAELELHTESIRYGDVVVDDFVDSYRNLTVKTLRMLKWVQQNCDAAEFTVKIDEDVHLNLGRFIAFLTSMAVGRESGKDLIAGQVRQGQPPFRDPNAPKYYTPLDVWPEKTFPDFIAGFFYVLGKHARRKIYSRGLVERFFPLEDVFLTGIIATRSLGMNLTNIPNILSYWEMGMNLYISSCDLQGHYMGVHFHRTNYNYLDCWKDFNNPTFVCSIFPLITNCFRLFG